MKKKKKKSIEMQTLITRCQEHNNNNNKSSNKIYTSKGKDSLKLDCASTFNQLCSHIYFFILKNTLL